MLGGIADRVLGRMGFVLMRQENFAERRGTLGWESLSDIPIAPKTIIDVGVAHGTPELYDAFPNAHLVLVEPLSEYGTTIDAILAARSGQHFAVALGSADTTLEINVEPENHLKSSFLERTAISKTGDRITRRSVPVRRLDSLLAGVALAGPVGLKIDVEGFELEVLRGATESLRNIAFVIIETSVADRFASSPRFAEVVGEMKLNGFDLFDILHIARDQGAGARHADLLFVRGTQAAL